MHTDSATIVTLLIWALTACGLFFGGRAAWRRRSGKCRTAAARPGPAKIKV